MTWELPSRDSGRMGKFPKEGGLLMVVMYRWWEPTLLSSWNLPSHPAKISSISTSFFRFINQLVPLRAAFNQLVSYETKGKCWWSKVIESWIRVFFLCDWMRIQDSWLWLSTDTTFSCWTFTIFRLEASKRTRKSSVMDYIEVLDQPPIHGKTQ